ncbi:unnamed protein product, partial [marine sediment metagenome]
MVLPEVVREKQVVDPSWSPDVPDYRLEISETDSWGAKARQLWENRLAELAKIPPENSQLLFTGIGGGVAGTEGSPKIYKFGDGSEIPGLLNLEDFGEIPELLFLVASAKSADNVLGLKGMARELKELYGN